MIIAFSSSVLCPEYKCFMLNELPEAELQPLVANSDLNYTNFKVQAPLLSPWTSGGYPF